MVRFADGRCRRRSELKRRQRLKLTALRILGVGRSEGRVVEGKVLIGFDEVVLGAIIVVAVDLIAVAGLEYGEEVVKEVVDFDDGFVGQRWQTALAMQIVFAHGMSLAGQRAAALRRTVVESGGEKTSR
jgi:hypothetical protein